MKKHMEKVTTKVMTKTRNKVPKMYISLQIHVFLIFIILSKFLLLCLVKTTLTLVAVQAIEMATLNIKDLQEFEHQAVPSEEMGPVPEVDLEATMRGVQAQLQN